MDKNHNEITTKVYLIGEDKYWSIDQAKWITKKEADAFIPEEIMKLESADGISDDHYLITTLVFYNYPLGELASRTDNPLAIKEELKRLDEEYLTPRTIAGLAVHDEYSIAQWEEHEKLAAPLRAKLEELTNS